MKGRAGRHLFTRRSFLYASVAVGLGAIGLAVPGSTPLHLLKKTTSSEKDEFVRRQGSEFLLGARTFYYGGTNNYYLHYQSKFMIDNVLTNAAAMGLRVIRLWGFMDGKAHNGIVMQEEPGVYPEKGYEHFDYTVWRAGQLGLKLVVVLTNNWTAFGGMHQYITWFSAKGHDDFYTHPEIKATYKAYVQHFLTRKNRYTGRLMRDEAAIMTWELANEPHCKSDPSGDTLFEWVREMSAFIKGLDAHHLVAVGDEGWYTTPGSSDWTRNGSLGVDWMRNNALPTIDYGTIHLYPQTWGQDLTWSQQWIRDHIIDGHQLDKPVVLEEYGWNDLTTRDAIYQSWTDTVYEQGGNGDQFWILTGLEDDGMLYPNFDGFRVTYPSSTAQLLSEHAARMRARSAIHHL